MKAYGYEVDTDRLLELREVTFDAEPSRLRMISKFLAAMADELEAGEFKISHQHIGVFNREWGHEGEVDVIVCGDFDMSRVPRVRSRP